MVTDEELGLRETWTYSGSYTITETNIANKGNDGEWHIVNEAMVEIPSLPSVKVTVDTPVVLATISGTVFEDTDNDGDGNVKLPGVLVTLQQPPSYVEFAENSRWRLLQDSAGTVLATTLTDSDGVYEFTDIQAGTYYVLQDNLGIGNPNNITVSVIGGDDSMGNDFVDALQDFCEAVMAPSCTLCVPLRSPGRSF